MGLARIAARKGAFDKAQSLRDQAEAAGVPADALAMERAVVAILQSDVAAARRELEALVREDESRLGAWRLLVDILTRSQDWLALERASERLRGRQDGVALAAEVQAVLALRDADIGSAKRYYAEALTVQPNNLRLLERALRLELMSANLPGAQDHARTILRLDGSHAIANYVIGAARLVDGEMGLAEEALRRSLARERLPQALNDLAWLLHGKKAYVEAESLAREATELRPTMHQAWDTLGDILMEMNRLPEAELALQKALSLTENSVGTFLHMAQLQAAKGDNDHAREIMLMIADRVSRLSSEDKREFDILQRTLNDG